jgi:hypothetical protein
MLELGPAGKFSVSGRVHRHSAERRQVNGCGCNVVNRKVCQHDFESKAKATRLAKAQRVVFLYFMSTVIANDEIADIQLRPHVMIRRQVQEWFSWMDHILDVHRNNFIFREPAPAQLEEHKRILKESIRACLIFNAVIADPDFNEPELTARLHVRIRQLQDAYDTFHDATLSDEQAGKILKEVFPE